MTADRYDAVVVGGGLIGLASAWRAAERGLRVAVVDPLPGGGASRAAAGMLAPVTELHYGEEALLALAMDSARRYPAFVADLEARSGLPTGYRSCGTLAVAMDTGDRDALAEVRDFQRSLGLEVEALTGRQCRRHEPLLSPGVQGGSLVVGDHQVDNRLLTVSLLEAARRCGVVLLRARVAALLTAGGTAVGVALSDGSEVRADTVVVAAGAHSGELVGVPQGVLPPVRPVKGQILRLRVPLAYAPFLTRTVRATVRGSSVYLVPRAGGELVVGATVEELGYDDQATAGGVYTLLRDAHAVVPAVSELAFVEVTVGWRPGSPDNAPVVGPTSVPGLVVATGHYRNGVLLTPVTADAVAELLCRGELPAGMRPFGPERFARAETPQEVHA